MSVAPEELPEGSKLVMCISEVTISFHLHEHSCFTFQSVSASKPVVYTLLSMLVFFVVIVALLLDHWPKSTFWCPRIPRKPIYRQGSNFQPQASYSHSS